MEERRAWIAMRDGIRLAARLWLPEETPAPVLLEALPYRMDDLTSSYASEYERLCQEGGFAVCRLDIRGTGSSEGIAEDEYTQAELDDICEVIAWLAAQEWSNGRVGMYGTSWSGFNSIQVACLRPPALGAIVPIYATDDRYTDDVHYMGGAVKAVDLVDWVTYMIACNVLPPVPAVYGDGWREEWLRRIEGTEPVGAALARGAARRAVLAPRVAATRLRPHRVPDDDRRGLGRRLPQQHAAHVRGAHVPEAPARRALEPHVDRHVPARTAHRPRAGADPLVRPLAARRRRTASTRSRRSSSSRAARRALSPTWRRCAASGAPSRRGRRSGCGRPRCARRATGWTRSTSAATRARARGSRARPSSPGDSRSTSVSTTRSRFVYDWEPLAEELELLGHPRLRLTLTPTAPVQYLSARLCDVFPDGTSALVTRGHPQPRPP